MAAKKTTTRKRSPTRATKSPTMLDKYGAAMKLFANYGAAGIFGGWLLVYTIPEAQKTFMTTLEKQADQQREDRKDAFSHAEHAVEKISNSIDGLKTSWSTVQGVTQGNQRALIEEQRRTNELLEQHVGSSDSTILPATFPPLEATTPKTTKKGGTQ